MEDYRDRANQYRWWKSINENTMTAKPKCEYMFDGEPENVKFRYRTCEFCEGRGSYVNPSIDSHGISADEWANEWEPEERESYMNGAYDVPCGCCNGNRVIPHPSDEAQEKQLYSFYEEEARYQAERDAERRMGC